MKKLVIFDLDGTLAESKAAIDGEMSAILNNLLSVARVAIISGGDWLHFKKQVLAHLPRQPAVGANQIDFFSDRKNSGWQGN